MYYVYIDTDDMVLFLSVAHNNNNNNNNNLQSLYKRVLKIWRVLLKYVYFQVFRTSKFDKSY
jgi:hypothetical protein